MDDLFEVDHGKQAQADSKARQDEKRNGVADIPATGHRDLLDPDFMAQMDIFDVC